MNLKRHKILYEGNVKDFEEYLLQQAEQEIRVSKQGIWCSVADQYLRQLTIISINPYPELEEIEDNQLKDENPPSIKHIIYNTDHNNFYRWGIQGGKTGNHRIVFAIHNFHKVILLHYFTKQYNGLIKRNDILPAEENYKRYCLVDPYLY